MTLGERGPVGDHGQAGDVGRTGPTGAKGDPGVAPWVVRKATLAYSLLVLGLMFAFYIVVETRHEAFDKIEARRIAQCESDNIRAELQLEDYRISLKQAEEANIERILGLTTEQANELRRISVDNAKRRISQVPFTDCKTGQRLPPRTP